MRGKRTTEQRRLYDILMREIEITGVVVRKWKRNGGGEALFSLGMVDVPKPDNAYLLGVAFHEMGHIILDKQMDGYTDLPGYMQEYHAEKYAIDRLRFYGLPVTQYRAYAVKYVLTCLANYKNKGGNVMLVPHDVRKWTGIRVTEWRDAGWIVVDDTDVDRASDVSVTFHTSRPKPNTDRRV